MIFIAFKLTCVARNFVINVRKLVYNLLSRLVMLHVKATYDMMINNLYLYDKLAINRDRFIFIRSAYCIIVLFNNRYAISFT